MTQTARIERLEAELWSAREEHDAELRAGAERARREEAERTTAMQAEEARQIREWQDSWKHTRLRCVVPPSCRTTHFCFGNVGRRWVDHRNAERTGMEEIPVLQDGPDRVVWLRSFNDYQLLLCGPSGSDFERVNYELNARRAQLMPQNTPAMNSAPQPLRY